MNLEFDSGSFEVVFALSMLKISILISFNEPSSNFWIKLNGGLSSSITNSGLPLTSFIFLIRSGIISIVASSNFWDRLSTSFNFSITPFLY